MEFKLDPGSRTTGMCLVALFQRGRTVVWAAELEHRSLAIRDGLKSRHSLRHSRYRSVRFKNRRRAKGWLPPSIQSRADNVVVWTRRLRHYVPITEIAVEVTRFDTQALQNPEIEGVEYQRGTLLGYEVWEYLLEKWGHKCAYCDVENVPLEKDHVHARSKGGSNRVSNLLVSCRSCNEAKDNLDVREFLKDRGVASVRKSLRLPMRWAILWISC